MPESEVAAVIDRQVCRCGHQRSSHVNSGRCHRGSTTGNGCSCLFFRFADYADIAAWIAYDAGVEDAVPSDP